MIFAQPYFSQISEPIICIDNGLDLSLLCMIWLDAATFSVPVSYFESVTRVCPIQCFLKLVDDTKRRIKESAAANG